jgi:hypothetical protein
MDTTDAAELVRELQEDKAEGEEKERFRSRAALAISILATLLAVATLGGDNVAEEMIHTNIKASDTWAFYQAKNIRQTSYNLAADAIENELRLNGGGLDGDSRGAIERKIEKYRATIARYDSEPDPAAPSDSLLLFPLSILTLGW